MEIAVDVDGVLLDTITVFCDIYNEIYENSKGFKPKTPDMVDSWEFYKDWNLPEEVVWKIFDEINKRLFIVSLIDKYAKVVMRKMKHGNVVDIVTARKKDIEEFLKLKLRNHKIIEGIQYDCLHTVNRRHKLAKLKMPYDLYIDDSPNLVDEIKKDKTKTLFLYDQNWNRHCKCEGNVIRVKNWKDIWDKYIKLKGNKK